MNKNIKINKKNVIETIKEIGKNSELLNDFFTDLLTPIEYIEIKKRWEIIKMLEAGVNQHEIAKKLGVGIATVTRGSKELSNKKGGFRKVLNKINYLKN